MISHIEESRHRIEATSRLASRLHTAQHAWVWSAYLVIDIHPFTKFVVCFLVIEDWQYTLPMTSQMCSIKH